MAGRGIMRTHNILVLLVAVVVLSACGGETPNAESPDSLDEEPHPASRRSHGTSATTDSRDAGRAPPFMPIDARSSQMVETVLGQYLGCTQVTQQTHQLTAAQAQNCANQWLKQCSASHADPFSYGGPGFSQSMTAPTRWMLRYSPAIRQTPQAWVPVEQCASILLPPEDLKAIVIGRAREWAQEGKYEDIAFCALWCRVTDDAKQTLVTLGADRGFEGNYEQQLASLDARIAALADTDDANINDVLRRLDGFDAWLAAHPDLMGDRAAPVTQKVAAARSALQARVGPGITSRLQDQLKGDDDALTNAQKMTDTAAAQGQVQSVGQDLSKVADALQARRTILGDAFDGLQVKLTTLQQRQTTLLATLNARADREARVASLKDKLCSNAASIARIRAFQVQQARVDQASGTRDLKNERNTAAALIQLGDDQAQVRRDLAAMGVNFSEAQCPRQ